MVVPVLLLLRVPLIARDGEDSRACRHGCDCRSMGVYVRAASQTQIRKIPDIQTKDVEEDVLSGACLPGRPSVSSVCLYASFDKRGELLPPFRSVPPAPLLISSGSPSDPAAD